MEQNADFNTNFKKMFLITFIISLSISALVGIIIFLLGNFGHVERKILFTTLAMGGFSLTALCSSTLYERNRFMFFSAIGMIVAIIGLLITLFLIWEVFDGWNVILISIILSASIAHSSLLLLIKSRKTIVNVLLILTFLSISTVALMLIFLVFLEFNIDFEFYYRFLGVFVILDVLGTIVTPITLKFTSMNE